ncbi:hypothetical protein CDV52_09490 [Haematobacter missouriensis]|uniref:Glycosyltransferase 2-like domain-containing protein n=1 Tax=Haematobacter missouriensis TaxID=366616 RepID=A0A212ARP2_9RHOB|nr:glycosyltransferase family 2 protein [Haematobacter missouriensis]OWJ84105.1 hypothetical protein CDV52_09490 [Haematobacter missouriensis]
MRYSCVIVTRNRLDALRLSLPAILRQTRRPSEIIVVDSSDDPEPIRQIVQGLGPMTDVPISYFQSAPGMTRQRNIGLAHVTGEVVMFPDDDSLLYPDAMEHIMRVYERDVEGIVGGVCAAEATRPNETAGLAQPGAYRRRRIEGVALALWPYRARLERQFFPDPFLTLAALKQQRLPTPSWLESERAIAVPYMTGFRMSFRTDLIRRLGFDEGLGRYALFEDIDASLRILDSHCLVAAEDAFIYHHKAPERRDSGRAMGAMHILNRAYVLAKDRVSDPADWARVQEDAKRFATYKTLNYRLRANPGFGQDRLQGAKTASALQGRLFSTPRKELPKVYAQIKELCLSSSSSALA